MTRNELIGLAKNRMNDYPPRDIDQAVQILIQSMIRALKRGERIDIRGFGNFAIRNRDPRQGRNPKTGQDIAVSARRVAFFKAGKELKKRIND